MIILDTNLISEPLRPVPEPRVVAWMDAQPTETLFLTAISAAELRAGIARLPDGKRRSTLKDSLEHTILPLFTGRILPFDLDCTFAYASLVATSRKTGQSIATADAFIAAIARTHGFAIATRDVAPFQNAGLTVINPWDFT